MWHLRIFGFLSPCVAGVKTLDFSSLFILSLYKVSKMLKDFKYALEYIFISLEDPQRPITTGSLEV